MLSAATVTVITDRMTTIDTEIRHAAPAADDGPPPEPPADQRRYTVDELAAAAGVPTRTIRHYQSERVLPAPERHGRIALYGDEHVRRLELIAQLQDRGLSLKAIREALRGVEHGRLSLEGWLGLGEELRRPWSEDAPALLSREDLEQRLDGRRPGLLGALVDADLLQEQPGLPPTYLVPSPGLLDVALELEAAGVDLTMSTEAAKLIRKHLRRSADDLVALFTRHAGDGFGLGPDRAGNALEALRPLSAEAVRLIFAREVERAVSSRREDLAAAMSRSHRGEA
jgi:DNA-binding transcriptional MerR regulator